MNTAEKIIDFEEIYNFLVMIADNHKNHLNICPFYHYKAD
jgi:hypothetical protein